MIRHILQSRLQTWRQRGHIVPSSRFLVNRLIRTLDYSKSLTIIQLGFGTGVITRALLSKLSPDSRLTVIELDPACQRYCPNDDRLTYITGCATDSAHYAGGPDIILSTLPLASLPQSITRSILKTAAQSLASNGMFIQFQYSLLSRHLIEQIFNRPATIEFEWLNIPPAFIYRIHKS